jgi:transcriptional regulator with PAS, ATPase and Fis domain
MMNDLDDTFFSNSPKMDKMKTIIHEIAKTDVPVLIKGETGTGKELLARVIHRHSHRHKNPFITVNCAAIPKGLLESELFGFEKGAFTGAYLKKPGRFELANSGTILLNEIGEVDITIQAKLLQALQDGTFSRLGGEGEISVNARVITTTHDHLETSILNGRFREDLFFRINVVNITVPPLRDRREQIPSLTKYFFDYYKSKYGKTVSPLSSKAMNVFSEYYWPGNVRELENMIKRIVLIGEEKTIIQDMISRNAEGGNKLEHSENVFPSVSKDKDSIHLKEVGKRAAENAEKEIIQKTLHETHWNRRETAKLLCVSYKALLYKIQKYHLDESKRHQGSEERTSE